MADPNFERKPLICPKCGSSRMVIQELYEMWETQQPKNAMPNFGASFKKRVLCAEIGCQAEVWPAKWGGLPGVPSPVVNDQEPEKPKGKKA